MKVASGHVTQCIGFTIVTIEFKEFKIRIKLKVVNLHDNLEIVIGQPFLKKYKAIQYHETGLIKLQDKYGSSFQLRAKALSHTDNLTYSNELTQKSQVSFPYEDQYDEIHSINQDTSSKSKVLNKLPTKTATTHQTHKVPSYSQTKNSHSTQTNSYENSLSKPMKQILSMNKSSQTTNFYQNNTLTSLNKSLNQIFTYIYLFIFSLYLILFSHSSHMFL